MGDNLQQIPYEQYQSIHQLSEVFYSLIEKQVQYGCPYQVTFTISPN